MIFLPLAATLLSVSKQNPKRIKRNNKTAAILRLFKCQLSSNLQYKTNNIKISMKR